MRRTTGETERRRFFRIEDRLPVALRRAEPGAAESTQVAEMIADVDRRIATIVAAARVQAPAVGELAELLNRKLEFVIDALGLRERAARRAAPREQELSISACGIGLNTAECFAAGDALLVELVLPPGETHLHVPARVVRCREDAPHGFRLQLDFTDLASEDQELLIQFIVRRQGQFLQRLREQRESKTAQLLS